MRVATNITPHPRRRTIAALVGLGVVIVLIVAVQALAGFYSNFLWFHWSGVGEIWASVTATKVLLTLTFFAIAFLVVFASLFVADKVVSRTLFMAPDTELVRRYQAVVGPHSLALRLAVSILVGLALGSGTSSQWQNWVLFEHAVPFGKTDPIFGRDISFFIFRLPFLSFLVDWIFGALVVTFIITAVSYFVNGAIRLQGAARIEPRAIAHLSLILCLMALERAWAFYFIDRFGLELSHHGVVQGASYADVHVRMPAMDLLAVVSLIAFAMLAFNIYQRTWVLPAVAVSLWVFLALAVGVIFPAIFQAVRVIPAQGQLEAPYIKDNIAATRQAMGINAISSEAFPANQDLTSAVLNQYQPTLGDVQLWDPVFSAPTFSKLQSLFSGYRLTNLAVDRYAIGGKLVPVVIAARELNTSGLPTQSWVNTHLQYTHGYGAVVAPANTNETTAQGGNPVFDVSNVPENSSVKSLKLKQTGIYFAPGDNQYVITDTNQPEVDYVVQSGAANPTAAPYKGGGIPIGSFISRLAFSIHLRDFNLLISKEITSKSRLIYIPDIQTEVQKALPFLTVDSNPYAVIDNGGLDWIVDAYVTSAYYPYAQTAATDSLSPSSALTGNYNYIRDSLKVVVNAYTGKMSFYSIGKPDPILKAYEDAFPGLIHPLASLQKTNPVLLQHLRYPQDLLTVQAEMYARYHVTNTSVFYNKSALWNLSETSTAANGSPSSALPAGPEGAIQRFSPIYELLQLPGESKLSFDALEPLVPYSADDHLKALTSLLVVGSDYSDYGKMQALNTKYLGNPIDSPGFANADILADATISEEITLLDQKGSTVTLGTVQILPIADSLLYVRPLYISSSQTSYPLLRDVVVVYGKQVSMAATLAQALTGIFGSSVSTGQGAPSPPSGTGTIPSDVREDITSSVADYQNAQAALARGDLGTYQTDIDAAGRLLTQANELLTQSSTANPTTRTGATKGTKSTTSTATSSADL